MILGHRLVSLQSPTRKLKQTPISPLGAAEAQKTLVVLPTCLNQTVDTSLHIFPKITNTLPVNHTDISQLKYVKTLLLADPTFKIPVKTGILLGVDVLAEIFLENRTRDNGVVILESFFGWVVSGPVKEVSNPFDYTISSNVSVVSAEMAGLYTNFRFGQMVSN